MTTKEGNILIAEFMNYELSKSGYGGWSDNNIRFYYETQGAPRLTFFDSWDLLMPVVYKCFSITITDKHTHDIVDALLKKRKIEKVYEAVITWISFYYQHGYDENK